MVMCPLFEVSFNTTVMACLKEQTGHPYEMTSREHSVFYYVGYTCVQTRVPRLDRLQNSAVYGYRVYIQFCHCDRTYNIYIYTCLLYLILHRT